MAVEDRPRGRDDGAAAGQAVLRLLPASALDRRDGGRIRLWGASHEPSGSAPPHANPPRPGTDNGVLRDTGNQPLRGPKTVAGAIHARADLMLVPQLHQVSALPGLSAHDARACDHASGDA